MTMPSPEKYQALLDALRHAKAALPKKSSETHEEARARQIQAALFALRSVIRYLEADLDVMEGLLTQPLGVIKSAVHDAAQGAKPAILNPPPSLVDGDKSRKGKASGTVGEDVQACLAFAVKLRMKEMVTSRTGDAAQWAAKTAATLGIRCANGAQITSQQVQNWWRAVNRGGREGPADTFRVLVERHADLLRPPLTAEKRKECGLRAAGVIKATAAWTPKGAPNSTERLKEKSA